MAKNKLFSGILSLSIGLSAATPASAAPKKKTLPRPPQYIMISFDGSYTLEMWKATREHGEKNDARYTHFISGVDFLTGSSKKKIPGATMTRYEPPRFNGKVRSQLGFGGDKEMMAGRVREVIASVNAGMEIGGHANGHFDGTDWSVDEWTSEFDMFHDFLWNVISINKIEKLLPKVEERDWKDMMATQNIGFRAPLLGRSKKLYQTLGQESWKIDNIWTNHRYRYDASDVSAQLSAWPTMRSEGIWNFPLVTIPVPGYRKPIISMDYNFYVGQSGGKENAAKGARYEEEMYQAYVNWFLRNYHGNRAPLNIGHHFSTWNKGAYWRALQRFVESVCTQPEVRCITYKEMVQILDAGLENDLEQLNLGDFDQRKRPTVQIPLVRLASAEVGTDASRWVIDGRRLRMDPNVTWSANGRTLTGDDIDLTQLARQGVTYITKTQLDRQRDVLIDWDTASDTATLKYLEQPDLRACDANAHEEKVNPADLIRGIDL